MPMTVTSIELASDEGGEDDRGPFYNSVYKVFFQGGFSAAALKLGAFSAGLPVRGGTRDDDGSVVVKKVSCKLAPGEGGVNKGVALYTVDWGIYPPTGNNVQNNPNPLSRLPEIRWGGSDITYTVTQDINQKPIVNAAGDPFDTMPTDFVRASSCTISRNEQQNPAATVANFSNTTNSGAMWGNVPAKNGLMGKIEAEKISEVFSGTLLSYWRVTYPMIFRKDGWTFQPANVGWGALDPSLGDQYYQIRDGSGNRPAIPQPLDANGYEAETITFLSFEIKDTIDWSPMDLPNPFT